MTTPPYPEGYQPYTGAPGPSGPQPTPPNVPPPYTPPYGAPPGYGAPPYGAPGYPPMYAPPPPQPRKNSNAGWIIGISIAVVVVLICGGCVAFAYYSIGRGVRALSTTVGVISTYSGFCVDETAQDYQSAYAYFSSNLQSQVSSDAFAQRAAQLDTRDGPVTSCLIQNGAAPQVSNSTATVQLMITRTPQATPTPLGTATSSAATPTETPAPTPATGASFTGALHLVLQGSVWKIDSIDSSLDLT